MINVINDLKQSLVSELETLWQIHQAAGLSGAMRIYSPKQQIPFRILQPDFSLWFTKEQSAAAVDEILLHYNSGILPNSPLLLDPVVHHREGDEYVPIGSGFAWATVLALGVEILNDDVVERIKEIGALSDFFVRGENERAGLKIIAIAKNPLPLAANSKTVVGCKELFDLAGMSGEAYAGHYLLSGISYLTNNGLFNHPDFSRIIDLYDYSENKSKNKSENKSTAENYLKTLAIDTQDIIDAAYCWNSYERHHSLYRKFGRNRDDVENNLRFFDMVARDVNLFDSIGPMRGEGKETFEFIVPGLLPRGSVSLLAAAGGAGKSSLAHQLCIIAATDYPPDEEAPIWLGQKVNIEKCRGVSIYFAGEDGPPIINARTSVLDPKGRAKRLMFQRTDFGDGISFAQHLRNLQKIPEVPLVVIDPARKYLAGDEEDAGVVSEFFEAIEEFAISKNSAVLVVHHLQKGAYPSSVKETIDLLRGSQVFIDRPRVIIGLYRNGQNTIAGIAKSNIPPNMGIIDKEMIFTRDSRKLSLTMIADKNGKDL